MHAKYKGSEPASDLVPVAQAARMLKVTTRTVFNLCQQGLLKPVWRKRKKYIHHADLMAFQEVFKGKTDFASVANIAWRAYTLAQMSDKRVQDLLELLGFRGPAMGTDRSSVLDIYGEAKEGVEKDAPVGAVEVQLLARKLLSLNEEYLALVEHYTGDHEPWRVFLNVAQHYCKHAPRSLFPLDYELSAAYGYLEAARRHLRPLAYFFMRAKHGRKTADDAFGMDEDYSAKVIRLLHP